MIKTIEREKPVWHHGYINPPFHTHQTSHADHSKFIFPGHTPAPIWCKMNEHPYLPSLLLAPTSLGVPETKQEHAQLPELNGPLLTMPA